MTLRERRRQHLLWMIRQWMRRHGAWFVFAIAFSLVSPQPAFAAVKAIQAKPEVKEAAASKTAAKAPAKKKDEKTVEKTLEGKLVFAKRGRMAVEFAQSEELGGEEMLLNLDKKVKLTGFKELSKLQFGDAVRVKYTETFKEPKDKGAEKFIVSRVGTEVVLVKSVPKPAKPVMKTDALVGLEGASNE